MSHFMAVAAYVHGSPREGQERFLQKRGWVRLVERADVWFNPNRVGADAHDVYLFHFAIIEAAREEAGDYRPTLRVHHHAGAGE
jgi:hypothetical protein